MIIQDTLQRIPLIQGLVDEDYLVLADIGTMHEMPAEHLIFSQGDPGDALYVVLAGQVRIFADDGEHELELRTLGPGDYFGEVALLDDAPRSASAKTIGPCRLFKIAHNDFLQFLDQHPTIYSSLFHLLAKQLRDNTSQRLGLYQQNERLRAEAELQRLRSLTQMVAGLAHEINTPLGIIQTAASMIATQLRPASIASLAKDAEAAEILADVVEAAKLIQNNISVAGRLIKSFKSLSVQQVSEARETTDILDLIHSVINVFRCRLPSGKLVYDICCEIEPADRLWDGYPGHLTQILLNFFTNIDRYAYPDGSGGRVEISLELSETRSSQPGFDLTIRDFGQGIPDSNLPQIFTPFFTTGRGKDGTGLGLAIVHNLVISSLGGTIKAESKLGKGTILSLRFPKKAPEVKA